MIPGTVFTQVMEEPKLRCSSNSPHPRAQQGYILNVTLDCNVMVLFFHEPPKEIEMMWPWSSSEYEDELVTKFLTEYTDLNPVSVVVSYGYLMP